MMFQIVRLVFFIALAGGCAFAVGYARTDIPIEIAGNDARAPWLDAEMPEDYSASKDRIEFELAALSLFGPAQSAAGETGDGGEKAPEILKLVAIANLDGTMFALVDEGHPIRQQLQRGQVTQNGWKIEQIEQSQVMVARGGERKDLKLFAN